MPSYRVAMRYGSPQRYHMEDIEAGSLAEALQEAAARVPPEVDRSADLVEIRRMADPDSRQYTGE